jgi:hypothetical protein
MDGWAAGILRKELSPAASSVCIGEGLPLPSL